MKTKTTQKEQMLNYLKGGYSLTPLIALEKFGSLRLSGVIFKLKKQGWKIKTTIINTPTNKRVAMYTLEEKRPNCGSCYYYIGDHDGSCKFQSRKIQARDTACANYKER